METLLKQHRESLEPKRPLASVATACGVNRSTLYRIEAGEVAPTRSTARKLFDYYAGRVPLAHIYDPEYAVREALQPAE
ncbi:MAG: helix-turn-helix transcriptional regulator [Hyphomicrobiaceae bacterium]|nr:helix-turn-helix transcriptional regulator [Hyphomicrobiaceae bacterium]